MNIHLAKSILRSAWLTAFIFLASTFAAFAQEAAEFPNFKAMPTGKGIMLMNKKGAPDFAVLIEGGSDPKYDAADGALRIKTAADAGEVSVYLAEAKLYAKTKSDADETLIKNYRARLLAAQPVRIAPTEKFAVDTETGAMVRVFDLRGGGKDEKSSVYSSLWIRPVSGSKTGARRVELSFVIGDSILTLRKDLPNADDTDEQNRAFESALATLTLLPPQKVISAPKKQSAKSRRRRN